MNDAVRLAHGFGGRLSQELLDNIIYPALSEDSGSLHRTTMDAAVQSLPPGRCAFSTDSFTVQPLFFPGGDMGTLAVAGTVNDLSVTGAQPLILSLSLIIEEGFPLADLERLLRSAGRTCSKAGVRVVTGDTKVVERGGADGIFMNTAGIGVVKHADIGPAAIREGDSIIISGTIGDHGAAILSAREQIGAGLRIESDCAPLNHMIDAVLSECGTSVHAMRDPTRGGLAAVMNEFAEDTGYELLMDEDSVPLRSEVKDFLDILGMDPFLLANEGKIVLFCEPGCETRVLEILKSTQEGSGAAVIGRVDKKKDRGRVLLRTGIGTTRILKMPIEPGLPRIC